MSTLSPERVLWPVFVILGVAASCAEGDSDPKDTTSSSSASASTSSGTGGGGPACGDGHLDPGEECDERDFGTATCADSGFPNGQLACDLLCRIVTTGCFREEKCDDGIGLDRDKDGLFGCNDDDCFDHAACTDPCSALLYAADLPASPGGWVVVYIPPIGHGAEPDVMAASCAPMLVGGEQIYPVVPAVTGTLKVMADTTLDGMDVSISARAQCADAASELACTHAPGTTEPELFTMPVVGGQTYFVYVDGLLPNTLPSMLLYFGLEPDSTGEGGGGGGGGGAGGAGGGGGGGAGGGTSSGGGGTGGAGGATSTASSSSTG